MSDVEAFSSRIDWHCRQMVALLGAAACGVAILLDASQPHAEMSEAPALEQEAVAEMAAAFADHYAASVKVAEVSGAAPAPRVKPAVHRADAVQTAAAGAQADGEILGRMAATYNLSDFKAAATLGDERRCLAQAIYYEARSESVMGQLAVADVVMNRVANKFYPNTICGVVFEGSERRTGCQFSFTCDGSMDRPTQHVQWRRSEELAGYVMDGLRQPVARTATHYHANYVSPYWADNLIPTAYIGAHMFYRFPSKDDVKPAAPATMF
ncbi:MAG: cell wall hydrolase [Pseudomonadota bacterium]